MHTRKEITLKVMNMGTDRQSASENDSEVFLLIKLIIRQVSHTQNHHERSRECW